MTCFLDKNSEDLICSCEIYEKRYFRPWIPIRSTKEGKLGYVTARDGSHLPQSIPAFSKHSRNRVASRIDVVLQDVSVLGNPEPFKEML